MRARWIFALLLVVAPVNIGAAEDGTLDPSAPPADGGLGSAGLYKAIREMNLGGGNSNRETGVGRHDVEETNPAVVQDRVPPKQRPSRLCLTESDCPDLKDSDSKISTPAR